MHRLYSTTLLGVPDAGLGLPSCGSGLFRGTKHKSSRVRGITDRVELDSDLMRGGGW